MTTIIIPGTNPNDYYELRCDAFNIQGPSLTSIVSKWNSLKPHVDQYADEVIKGIYHTNELETQAIEQKES